MQCQALACRRGRFQWPRALASRPAGPNASSPAREGLRLPASVSLVRLGGAHGGGARNLAAGGRCEPTQNLGRCLSQFRFRASDRTELEAGEQPPGSTTLLAAARNLAQHPAPQENLASQLPRVTFLWTGATCDTEPSV